MAMLKYGNAVISTPIVSPDKWVEKKAGPVGRIKVAKNVLAAYDPSKWLLTHSTIMASVDVEDPDSKKEEGYLIKPEYSIFVNNNGDSWERNLLKIASKTFLGADNFLEHVQLGELSKGKVIDMALREVPFMKKDGKDLTALYVDILIATSREHKDLISQIISGEYNALSMGCFKEGTEITLSDGTKRRIEDILPGDLVITHTGKKGYVNNVQRIYKKENIFKIKFQGDYKEIYVTKEHPFWAFKRDRLCACGCGTHINSIVRGGNNEFMHSKYATGHYSRVVNPNPKILKFNTKDDISISEKLKLSWVEAKDLKENDFLSYPISDYVENDYNATVDKARLLGYFAAEGSYVKEVSIEGEENEYAVRCKVCGRLYNTLITHIKSHKLTTKEYKDTYPGAALKANKNYNFIKSSRNESVSDTGLIKTRRNVGLEFSLGEHEYNTVNKEICDLAKQVFPNASVLRYKNAVKVISEEACSFMKDYCGEYSDRKKFIDKVLYWPVEIQKHLVATWLIGDYSYTVSKDMSDQFRFILSRCGVRYNSYKEDEKEYTCNVTKTINGSDDSIVTYSGMKKASYYHQINTIGFSRIKSELNYAFLYNHKKLKENINKVTKSYASYNDKYMLRKIESIEEVPFEGFVYNLEVEGDNSYIANDAAVHNCQIRFSLCSQCGNKAEDDTQACKHVRFFKNNYFYDKNGVKRIIAELCGHKDDESSCKFIDASWVRKPAFEGAVLRNILDVSGTNSDISEKIKNVINIPAFEAKPGMYLKAAASKIASDIVREITSDEKGGKVPPLPPKDATPPSGGELPPPPDDTGFPEASPEAAGGDLTTDTPSTGGAGAPPSAGPLGDTLGAPGQAGGDQGAEPHVDEPLTDATVKEVKDLIKKEVLNDIRKEILKEQAKKGEEKYPTDVGNESNDNLISKESMNKIIESSKKISNKRLLNGLVILSNTHNWKEFKKYGYSRNDLLGILYYLDKSINKNHIGHDAIKALSNIKLAGSDLKEFFTELVIEIDRAPSKYEAKKLASWGKILSDFEK